MKRFLPFIIIIIIVIALTLSGMSFFSSFKNDKSAINNLGIELKNISKSLAAQLIGFNFAPKNKMPVAYNYDYIPPVSEDGTEESNSQIISTISPTPSKAIDTYIISGPNNGDVLELISGITFRFDAQISSEKSGQQVVFETKVSGLDTSWQTTYSKERVVNFPMESKQYVFSVRARVGNLIDQTPATRSFSIKMPF